MGKTPTQRDDLFLDRRLRAMRTRSRRMRTIPEPFPISARPPSPPRMKRVPAHAVAATEIRNAPMPSVVVRQHPNPLLHPTGLHKWHRKSSFRPSLTCQPSTQSKASGIYPVHTMAQPLTPALSPHRAFGRTPVCRRAMAGRGGTPAQICSGLPSAFGAAARGAGGEGFGALAPCDRALYGADPSSVAFGGPFSRKGRRGSRGADLISSKPSRLKYAISEFGSLNSEIDPFSWAICALATASWL